MRDAKIEYLSYLEIRRRRKKKCVYANSLPQDFFFLTVT